MSFHPDYLFEGEAIDDQGIDESITDPGIHILREERVSCFWILSLIRRRSLNATLTTSVSQAINSTPSSQTCHRE